MPERLRWRGIGREAERKGGEGGGVGGALRKAIVLGLGERARYCPRSSSSQFSVSRCPRDISRPSFDLCNIILI